jgi:hypothetical protein
MKDPSPIGQALHSRRKYVASSTLTPAALGGHHRGRRRGPGAQRAEVRTGEGELQVHGSGALVRWLLENALVDTRATLRGVTFQVFRVNGRPDYATSTANTTSRQR